MHTLSTLHRLHQHLGLSPSDTADDRRLLAGLAAASAALERETGRRFAPRQADLLHDIASPSGLVLADDLLSLTALADTASIDLALVRLQPAEPPHSILRLIAGRSFVWSLTPLGAVTVSGLWGWHDRPADMWRSSGDTVRDNPLTASASAVTVSDADWSDSEGESPRFQVGQLLRCESEFIRVLSVSTTANTLAVLRGANGTAPAVHALGVPLECYQPPAAVESLVLRWAAWLYREPDAMTAVLPADLRAALSPLRRLSVRAADRPLAPRPAR